MDYEKKYKEALERMRYVVIEPKNENMLQAIKETVFPELKESEDERIRKELIEFVKSRGGFKQEYIAWLEKQGTSYTKRDVDNAYVEGMACAKNELEKQGKQENAERPKFKVGDYVVNNETSNLCHIFKIEYGQYICDDCSFLITKENKYHLWTIQDAKDGDVLALNDTNSTLICMCPNFCDTGSYCRLGDGHFIRNKEYGWASTLLTPATKEQRELLFQKMKEAGYTFDFVEKELKKIREHHLNS